MKERHSTATKKTLWTEWSQDDDELDGEGESTEDENVEEREPDEDRVESTKRNFCDKDVEDTNEVGVNYLW
tara:strand:+ start:671 stop:883 length:213 start_codon:yes stop_codon:yes gene_type:complete